ncbi:MAG: hypothetical protein LQ340_003332 [Diploschistes diacapsis]|nr:MAG: hypothetical protein LQ340_003332 [Diploschistes diacapsis]
MDTDKVQPEILKDVGIETSALKFELAIRNNATDKKGGRIRGGGGGGLTSGSSGETENLSIQWIWGTAFATTAALLLCENSVLSFASVFFDTAHASPVSNDWTRREAILTRVSETNDSCDIADFKGEGGSSIVGERGEDMERHHSDSRSWLLHRLSMNQNMAILPLALNFLSMSMAKVKIGARSSISLFLIYLAFLQTVRASAPMADDFNGVPPPEHNTTALILDQSIPGCTSTFACGPNNQASASNGIPSMLFPVGAALVISTFLSGPEIGRWLAILGFPLTALASAVPEPTYGFAIETTKAPLSTPMLVMTSVTYPQLLQDDIASTSDLNDDSDIFQGYSTDHHNSSTHASAHKKPPRKTGTAESSRGANPAGDSPDPTVAHELRDHWNAVATPIEFVEGGVGLFGLPAINCCAPLPSATVAPSAAS